LKFIQPRIFIGNLIRSAFIFIPTLQLNEMLWTRRET